MTSLVPADDVVEQRLEQPSLVGDGVLADVDATLLQRLLDEGGHLFAVRWCAETTEGGRKRPKLAQLSPTEQD